MSKYVDKDRNGREIRKWTEKHRGELVLDSFKLVEVVGWTDIKDDDYYYVLYDRIDGIYLSSCVGQPLCLKGNLRIRDYINLVRFWMMNNVAKKTNSSKLIIL